MLVREFLGAEPAPVSYENEDKARRLMVDKKIQGEVVPVPGQDGKDIMVATATRGRVRAFGRVWDFDGRTAEIDQIDWNGPR